jgi:hypothetical protein
LSKELNKQILNNQKEMKKYELPDKFSFIEFNKIKNLQERDEIKKILVNQFKKHYEENNKIPIREKNLENYHYSKKELEELELLDLPKMNREINNNKFILCQIISKPIFAVSMLFIIEDKNGDFTKLSIYNYYNFFHFQIGTKIIIKGKLIF